MSSIITRIRQLLNRSTLVIRTEGLGAFLKQTYKWVVLGERTYPPVEHDPYAVDKTLQTWLQKHAPTDEELDQQRQHTFTYQPLFSIVVPVYNPPADVYQAMIASVLAQTYPHFELILANGGAIEQVSTITAAFDDERITLLHLAENKGISANTNAAIEHASGDFIVFMDHDDLIKPHSLYIAAEALNEDPTIDVLYSDQYKINVNDGPFHPLPKPDWSPELLHNGMYTGHLSMYRSTLVEQVGRLRPAYDGSQDYDLILRISEHTDNIHHLPHMLYVWRAIEGSAAAGGKDYARTTNLAALKAAMQRRGYQGYPEPLIVNNRFHFKFEDSPLVSIIIPTDEEEHILIALKGLYNKTAYPNFEVIVCTNSQLADTLDALPYDNLYTARYDGPFNFSLKCNLGAQAAHGDYYLFLNDDVTPLDKKWLAAMMEYAQQDEIGGVSGKLLYTNNTIQYAGMITGVRDFVGTAFHTWERHDQRSYSMVDWVRNVSVLTGACLLIKRDIFDEIDGWDANNAPIANSDLDISFKLREAGYRLVYVPYAELRHVGHQSIGKIDAPGERRFDRSHLYLLARWGDYISYDPYFPPNMVDFNYHLADGFRVHAQYSPDNVALLQNGSPAVLFTAFDLSLSGAPIIMLQAAKNMREAGLFITVASVKDGPLRAAFEAADIPVIIDPYLLIEPHRLGPLFYSYDLIIANTIECFRVINYTRDNHKTMWLVHEPEVGLQIAQNHGPQAKKAFANADVVVYPAHSARAIYQKWAGTNRHEVIYYGISDPTTLIEPDTHNSDTIQVVFSGTIEERKGVDLVIDMLHQLPPEALNQCEITFVGRFLLQSYADAMRARCADLPNVTFTGEVSHQTALQHISNCDIFLCASRDETGPIVVIEAMAFGKPVITSRVGAVGEKIEHGVQGFLFEVGDVSAMREHLLTLLEDANLRHQMGQQGRQLFERAFNKERYAQDMLTLATTMMNASEAIPSS